MKYAIRDASPPDGELLARIIRQSFEDVALRFGLTAENCPKHPSNCTPQWIDLALTRGVEYFLLEQGGIPCGCVALEHARPQIRYLERLAVLPDCRRRGFGRALVDFAVSRARASGADRVEIGIISGQRELKEWYSRIGFRETRRAAFPHLPFEVAFMAKTLAPPD